jgi:DNA modification methylase
MGLVMVEFPTKDELFNVISNSPSNSVDSIIIITGALIPCDFVQLKNLMNESIRVLREGGLLFVQGYPENLPDLGVYLDKRLVFKYWIAIKSFERKVKAGLPSVHAAVLMFVKGNGRFHINQVRFPHEQCSFCGKSLRDWGGKAHLMNPEGYAASDVWKAYPAMDNYTQLSSPVIDTILKMVNFEENNIDGNDNLIEGNSNKRIIVGPAEGVGSLTKQISEPYVQAYLPIFAPEVNTLPIVEQLPDRLWNVVHRGDALEVLKRYPDNSIDLVFADPPYNLDKNYSVYDDGLSRNAYLDWCNAWLQEYIRILKPTGSLYLLNLPHWSMYHASYLNQYLYFQNWIVWDALSEPRGKLMPAHYSLLFYTKSPTGFTYNHNEMQYIDSRQYCLRGSCIHRRRQAGEDHKDQLTDIWSNIHRLKHRRDRDYHPCQLPDSLMERIIRLSTREGDIVLDALAGTGTTAVVSKRLGRNYVAIDIDEAYVKIAQDKLAKVENLGYVPRQSIQRHRTKYSKKTLQIELQRIASIIGRLPTLQDVQEMSLYGTEPFITNFSTWGKALKAAKLEMMKNGNSTAKTVF